LNTEFSQQKGFLSKFVRRGCRVAIISLELLCLILNHFNLQEAWEPMDNKSFG